MGCPSCRPACKCYLSNDPEWRHNVDCEWLLSRLRAISVQLYQAETFKEWLRLGLKIFHLPAGFTVPPPWDMEKVHPATVGEGNRHPFYRAFKANYLPLLGVFQWQWDPSTIHDQEDAHLIANRPHDKEP